MTESRDLSRVRREYAPPPIDLEELAECPFEQFDRWFTETLQAELLEPNAMVLATVSAETGPTARTVLLKYFDRQGFVFFTNYGSRKARQIDADARVSLLFPWYGLQRQVEIDGVAEKISVAESVQGASRWAFHVPVDSGRYSNRSCSRSRPPCQNSNRFGRTRKPPQNEGIGTSPFANFRFNSSYFDSKIERELTTSLCWETQAPIWLPRGRLAP